MVIYYLIKYLHIKNQNNLFKQLIYQILEKQKIGLIIVII